MASLADGDKRLMSLRLLVLVAVAGLGQGGGAVRCVCSSPAECEPLTDADCPDGAALVWDPCGCCRVCARLEFEPCGGPDGFHGTCAAGLECVADHADLLGTCRRKYQFAKFPNWSTFLEVVYKKRVTFFHDMLSGPCFFAGESD
jgi:Insulin-like growth factor binding protein